MLEKLTPEGPYYVGAPFLNPLMNQLHTLKQFCIHCWVVVSSGIRRLMDVSLWSDSPDCVGIHTCEQSHAQSWKYLEPYYKGSRLSLNDVKYIMSLLNFFQWHVLHTISVRALFLHYLYSKSLKSSCHSRVANPIKLFFFVFQFSLLSFSVFAYRKKSFIIKWPSLAATNG